MKKFFAFLLLISLFFVPASAATYSNNYPGYIGYKGAIYLEAVYSDLGKGAVVFPYNAQNGVFCLSDTGGMFNISDTAKTGVFVSAVDGSIREVQVLPFHSLSYFKPETNTFEVFTFSEIENTNIDFVDTSGSGTSNSEWFFHSKIEMAILAFIIADLFFDFVGIFINLFRRDKFR